MKKKLKPETGDRKGRGEQMVKDAEILNFEWWILNVGLAVRLRALRLRRDAVASGWCCGELLVAGCGKDRF